jgi:hypothetical protein
MSQGPEQNPIMRKLRRPLTLTWAGLIAERVVRAFWPFWTLLALSAAALMLGLHDVAPVELVWVGLVLAALGLLGFFAWGLMRFRWPHRQEAVARMDAALPGRPLTALSDQQVIGAGDAASERLWRAHLDRMADRAAAAGPVEPNLRLSDRDPFGLRYVALLGLMVALLFGSVLRVGSVTQMAPGNGTALATGPTWEGWVEPPSHTGRPSLYLIDQTGEIRVPEGSRVTLRLYGEVGALSVAETVSRNTQDVAAATDPEQSFVIAQSGELSIDGPGGRAWEILALPDTAPRVSVIPDALETSFDGQMSQPFEATDDYGVVSGKATFRLDLDRVDRRYGLGTDPEPRDPIVLELPMPITGDRADFTETLIENLSQHPWAHLPVTLELEVTDDAGNIGLSVPEPMDLPARRFFDPLAASVIEMRRDLLWSRENAPRIAQVLRAVSHAPETGLFRSETAYLRCA